MQLKVIKGDITEQDTDAIVNAANSTLLGGGGVDGAIHSKAGPALLKECRKIREESYPDGIPTGKAVITKGYGLKAGYVIHTVGPVYRKDKNRSGLLKDCLVNSLRVAENHRLKSISFPAISTGAYRYPKKECARLMRQAFSEFDFDSIQEVRV
ncbi:O-acetyl-ADP-ribose deacetylase, partial [Candidatus Woesearchaeota archaeon]|nr:O-acetyl-ADP-ribose deacetylase [Candidatus Woesearchaeota archaeon]